MNSLYIHIPFCQQKCLYCDFLSFANKQSLYESYTKTLVSEIIQKSHLCKNQSIQTIFFGGGTPTILPIVLLQKIIHTLFCYYTISNDAEITIEANPGTITLNSLRALRNMEFNRISIGFQAWQNELLQKLGRIHNRSIFLQNYDNAKKAGFDNINVDLMFSLPEQSYSQWQQTLYSVAYLQPEHISAYSLIVEEGTPFFKLFEQNQLSLPEEQVDRAMYHMAQELLLKYGYHQYEISNFAKKGYESRHNKVYWQTKQYLGFGLGAHSYYHNKRFHNTYNMQKYIQSKGNPAILMEEVEKLTVAQMQSEFLFMGLRMTEGICEETFQKRFGVPLLDVYGKQIAKLIKQELLQYHNKHYFLTNKGIDLSNVVFCEFV